jgi:hypothetical protein
MSIRKVHEFRNTLAPDEKFREPATVSRSSGK